MTSAVLHALESTAHSDGPNGVRRGHTQMERMPSGLALPTWSLEQWLEGLPLHTHLSQRLTRLVADLVPDASGGDAVAALSQVWLQQRHTRDRGSAP